MATVPTNSLTANFKRSFSIFSVKKEINDTVYDIRDALAEFFPGLLSRLEDLLNKSNLNIDKELDGFYEPTLFDF